jgi:hypothetical protein
LFNGGEEVLKDVFTLAEGSLRVFPDSELSFSHPLMRRLTLLQKAVIELASVQMKKSECCFEKALKDEQTPLYFATALGEFNLNLDLLRSLMAGELPLSPTAFQHSVHNCPLGYLSIVFGLKNPSVTLCAGVSPELQALQVAKRDLRLRCLDKPNLQHFAWAMSADFFWEGPGEKPAGVLTKSFLISNGGP